MARWVQAAGLLGATALLAGCGTVSTVGLKNTTRSFTTVVVDAGHGGRDSGAYRRYGPPEKAATLAVATKLNEKLRGTGLKTVMTRTTDVFVPLDTRVEIENAQENAVFVSIHFNDSRRGIVKGFETYYHSPYAEDLARRIQDNLCTIPGSVNRGIHKANYRVLRNAIYPAVLVECGYLSNRSEGREARSDDYRDLLAGRIAEAILEMRYGAAGARMVKNPSPPGEEPAVVERGPGLAPATLGGSR